MRLTVTIWVILALVPTTFIVYVPLGVFVAVCTVSIEVKGVPPEPGLRFHVTPAGGF